MAELNEKFQKAWEGFKPGAWQDEINTRDFIQKNYTPYEGDESFLKGATEATKTLWASVMEGIKIENKTLTEMETAIAAATKTYDANTALTTADNTLTLTWAWDKDVNHQADTVLGNIAAGIIPAAPEGASTNLNFTITMTAIQVVD